MKIKANRDCFTPEPARGWTAGEVVEVSEKDAEQLLKNKNFVLVKAEKAETEQENDEQYRTKRGTGGRN